MPNNTKEKSNSADEKPIVKNRFFSIHGRERNSPNEFTEFGDAIDNFRLEVFKAFKIPQIVEWLSKRLK